ncbi:MAG TPA: hypothetical protein VFF03_15000 [Rhodocyclaceae bacterium]|nr:hypothetical protein [Rhodocyclaceae bacterium]
MAEETQVQIRVTQAAWSETLAAALAPAIPDGHPDDLRLQVESGAAALFRVESGGEEIGGYILRVDQTSQGREGVIVAAGGHLDGVSLVDLLLPHMEAQFAGVRAVRIHTSRPGMAKKLAAHGYRLQEIVLRKDHEPAA